MQAKEPSRTAWGAARHRAVHQLAEEGRIFKDPLAVPILGVDPSSAEDAAFLFESDDDPGSRMLRFFIAARSAFAEAKLAEAVEQRGVSQLVVLGAGFDTFAYRNPYGAELRVFEVDHPPTQAWKRERLAGIDVPKAVWPTFVGVDFERESFADRLAESGFDVSRRTFVFWLGVTMYLTQATIDATLAAVAGWPGRSEIVFDYGEPSHVDMSRQGGDARQALAARVAAVGEPFIGFLEPSALHSRLGGLGFVETEDLHGLAIAERFLGPEAAAAARAAGVGQRGGGHFLFART